MKTIDAKSQRSIARSTRADGDATRQHILETAGKIFSEFGYATHH